MDMISFPLDDFILKAVYSLKCFKLLRESHDK